MTTTTALSCSGKYEIPYMLDVMLCSLVQNDDGVLHLRHETLKLSFAQYTVHAIKRSHKNSDILLPTIVETVTNKTEFIDVVNKLGHRASYSLLMKK